MNQPRELSEREGTGAKEPVVVEGGTHLNIIKFNCE